MWSGWIVDKKTIERVYAKFSSASWETNIIISKSTHTLHNILMKKQMNGLHKKLSAFIV